MATSKIESNLDSYSLSEKIVGTWIDGSPIYRKCKVYTWTGSTNYDTTFFDSPPSKVINQRVQIISNNTYAKTMDYWNSSDFCRCWIYLTSNPANVCFNIGGASTGAQVLMVVDYIK